MKKSYRTAAVIVAIIVALLIYGQLSPVQDNDATAAASVGETNETAQNTMAVKVRSLQSEPYSKNVVLRGYTEALRRVSLKSQVKARIVALPIEKGTRVSAGDAICQLDVEDRKANYDEAVALVRQRELEFKASEELFAKGHRSETQHSAAKSAMEAAIARSIRMKVDMDNTVIRAPFDGVVDDRLVEVGDYMREGDVCALIMEEDPFLVVADISENYIANVKVGDPAYAVLQNGNRVDGKIRYISAIANAETRTFRIELEVANPEHEILDGITAELFISTGQIMAHKMSPALLVLNDKGLVGVRLVESDNTVTFQEVEILGNSNGEVWVSGISDNARLIVEGQEFVKAGEPVKPVM